MNLFLRSNAGRQFEQAALSFDVLLAFHAQRGVGQSNLELVDVVSFSRMPRLELLLLQSFPFLFQARLVVRRQRHFRVDVLQIPIEILAFERLT